MSKIISDTTSLPRKGVPEKAVFRVILVAEHYLDVENMHSLSELTRLLNPDTAEITLIHAMSDILTDLPTASDAAQVSQCIRQREKQQERNKNALRAALESSGFRIVGEQKCSQQDECAEQILGYIPDAQQDLLIIYDTHPSNGAPSRNHFSMLMATHAQIPVLLLRQPLAKQNQHLKVLFGVDGTEATLIAAQKLPDLLKTSAIEIILATVQSPLYQENAIVAPFVNAEILDNALEANASLIFEMVRDVLESRGVSVSKTKMLIGSPATELGQLAQLEHPELIMVGAHNKKGFLPWLTGSVSSQLLHWDIHNILVVR